jgi:hypothetical protein
MKQKQISWLASLLFACSASALAQDGVMLPQQVTLDDSNGSAFDSVAIERTVGDPLMLDDQPTVPEKPYPWKIAIYPALAWAPFFGARIDLPPTPSHPIAPSGSTTSSINGAYFGGARFERGKWSGDFLFMWAALSANRKSPTTDIGLDFVFGDAMVGYEVFRGLYVEGGFRRLALDLHATVDTSNAAVNPGYWDPLIGLTYRRQLGKKWRVLAHSDGGGFGAGSDVDFTFTARGEWQFARHYGLTMGYGLMHLSDSAQFENGTLHLSPTLHGPIIGFGLYF